MKATHTKKKKKKSTNSLNLTVTDMTVTIPLGEGSAPYRHCAFQKGHCNIQKKETEKLKIK